ncbi:MAG: N-acetylmuramoyl-L-alanine amidase [Algibacter sp.]|uniref:N-acetylmuramoyl-L-alanine amidase family protein n=1 Tax=Algibacter sp. TaxID=1872428 RepID=UPI002624B869|nr:N-acetylmuramoyl-L-alanine amidase [Algibacter sp.]MDG1729940.1 N-acetylmuramoyl-L-alanine amidase [Algibacter sp.]
MRLKNVVFLLVLLKMCISFGQNEGTKKRIVIDVGHGGIDPGAIGINNIQEKDVVLNIAKAILRLNKDVLNSEFDLYLTRYSDTLISLSDRSRLTKALDADVFVSLHCNASKNSSRGMEFYVNQLGNLNTKSSIGFGLSVLNESTKKLGFKERGVKWANFQVLRETIAFCPAILVEMGFVTHVDEARYFSKLENIRAIALAILLGIDNYLNNAL